DRPRESVSTVVGSATIPSTAATTPTTHAWAWFSISCRPSTNVRVTTAIAAATPIRPEATRPSNIDGRRSRAHASPVMIRSSGSTSGLVGSVGPVDLVYWPARPGGAVAPCGPAGGVPAYPGPYPGAGEAGGACPTGACPTGGCPTGYCPAGACPVGAGSELSGVPGAASGLEGTIHGRLVPMDIDAFVAVHAARWDRLRYLLK